MQWIKSILEKHVDDEGKFNLEEAQTEVNKAFPHHAVPKSEFNEKNEELKQAKKEIEQRDDQLTELGKVKPEELKGKISELETANVELANTHKEELKKLKVDHAVGLGLIKGGAKNTKAVSALLDLENAELTDEGAVKGLDEQLEALKKSDAYLFDIKEPTEPAKPGFKGAEPGKGKDDGKTAKTTTKKLSELDYVERLELKESNPEQYEKLLKQ